MTDVDVTHQSDQNRFVARVEGHEAELTYRPGEGRLTIEHTRVPDEIGGQGVGGELVRAAVRRASDDQLTVVPRCPYARGWLEQHPDVASTVTIDWDAATR